MGTIDRVIRGLDKNLLKAVKEEVRRQNRGVHGWNNRASMGKVINEMMAAWLDNGGSPSTATPQILVREMLQDVIKRAEMNLQVTGTPAVQPEEVDLIVKRRLARSGRILRPDTFTRYRDTLIHGYLTENRESFEGIVFKTFSPTPIPGYV